MKDCNVENKWKLLVKSFWLILCSLLAGMEFLTLLVKEDTMCNVVSFLWVVLSVSLIVEATCKEAFTNIKFNCKIPYWDAIMLLLTATLSLVVGVTTGTVLLFVIACVVLCLNIFRGCLNKRIVNNEK